MNISINVSSFNDVCRICLQNKGNTPIMLTTEIIHMIESCTSVQENYIDNKMPQQLCNSCYTNLKIAYEFKQQYFKATEILTEIILKKDQTQPKIEIDDEKVIKTEVKQENDFEYEQQLEVYTEVDNCENFNDLKIQDLSGIKDNYLDDKNRESQLNLKKQPKKEKKSKKPSTKKVSSKDGVICKVCGKKLKCQRYYKAHVRSHSDERPYKCTECEKAFTRQYILTAHKREKHENPNLREICFICGASLLPTRFHDHMFRHHRNSSANEKVKCNICNSEFASVYTLRKHNKLKHTDAPPLRYDCDTCDKKFSTKDRLREHKQRVHTDERKFKCEFCDKSFKVKYHRKKHTDSVHKDIRPHPCSLCHKAFYTRTLLKKHMVSHTGERPHTCDICGKGFGTKTHLRAHQKIHLR